MSFNEVKSARKYTFTAACAVGVVNQGRGYRVAKFRVSGEIVEKLGWTIDDRIGFFWGDGADAGRVMLAPSPGGVRPTWPGRSRAIYFSTPRVPDRSWLIEKRPLEDVRHEIDGQKLLLDLPSFMAPSKVRAAAE